MQMNQYFKLIKAYSKGDVTAVEMLENKKNIFNPFTTVQPELRDHLVNRIIDEYQESSEKKIISVLPFAMDCIIEVTHRMPEYPRYQISAAKGYGLMYAITNDSSYLKLGEQYYKLAQESIKGNPEVNYGYTVNLVNQGRFDEAVELARSNLFVNPKIALSYHYLGLALYRSGPSGYDEALVMFEEGFDNKSGPVLKTVTGFYNDLFVHYYQKKDVKHFSIVLRRLIQIDQRQSDAYTKILEYVERTKRIPPININS
jgi:tetratricopeptide (TPR) repeat protein